MDSMYLYVMVHLLIGKWSILSVGEVCVIDERRSTHCLMCHKVVMEMGEA